MHKCKHDSRWMKRESTLKIPQRFNTRSALAIKRFRAVLFDSTLLFRAFRSRSWRRTSGRSAENATLTSGVVLLGCKTVIYKWSMKGVSKKRKKRKKKLEHIFGRKYFETQFIEHIFFSPVQKKTATNHELSNTTSLAGCLWVLEEI